MDLPDADRTLSAISLTSGDTVNVYFTFFVLFSIFGLPMILTSFNTYFNTFLYLHYTSSLYGCQYVF